MVVMVVLVKSGAQPHGVLVLVGVEVVKVLVLAMVVQA